MPPICGVCAALRFEEPILGPEYKKHGAGTSTHLVYRHQSSVHYLENSASALDCQLCALILASIQETEECIEDEWQHADILLDEFTAETAGAEVEPTLVETHSRIFSPLLAPGTEVDVLSEPVHLEVVFRAPIRLEPENRCTDIIVHWTDEEYGVRRRASNLGLLSGLPDRLINHLENSETKNDTHTGSASSLDLGELWMQSCNQSHEFCRETRKTQSRRLPTRLIDVGNSAQGPFLYISKENEKGNYVALSHCWGLGKQFTTQVNSLNDRQEGIELEEMPKTFRDAIQITRHLQLQYLWIDSLCIVQDSVKDWQIESAQMGRYYREASLTLFATAATGDDMKDTEGSVSFVQKFSRHKGRTRMPVESHPFETVRKLSNFPNPLHQRGWTLQEWILSSRALSFDDVEIQWSCPSMLDCECIPEGLWRDHSLEPEMVSRGPSSGHQHDFKRQELLESWYKIVQTFSKRRLTYAKDKLPALAGIASEFSKYSQAKYLAGLWEDDLRASLCWFVAPETPMSEGPFTSSSPTYRAPSWSWANIDGPFRFSSLAWANKSPLQSHAAEFQCTILECWTKPVSSLNPLGEVVAGALTLKGRLKRAIVSEGQSDDKFFSNRRSILDETTGQALGWIDPDDRATEFAHSEVWCMIVSYRPVPALNLLALVPATTCEAESVERHGPLKAMVFKRVGLISDKGPGPESGVQVASNYRVGPNTVNYELTDSASTLAMLLDWIEEAPIEEISVI